jgi:predicted phage tail protein
MARRKLILHGSLKSLAPNGLELEADTVYEAVNGMCKVLGLKPDLVRGRRQIKVLGFETEELLHAHSDTEELHVFPALAGGSGLVKTIVGAVLIVIGAVLTFVPGMQAFGYAVISSGIGMMLGGIYEMLFPVKKPDTTNFYQGAPGNTTEIGTRIALIFGTKVKVYGHFLSYNIDAISR